MTADEQYLGEELFDHQVTAWTAGQLRKALDGIPDDMPVRIQIAEEPGGVVAGPQQVAIGAGEWHGAFEIGCEYPPGEYYRRPR
jgi:Family of unknown function (DUF6225)